MPEPYLTAGAFALYSGLWKCLLPILKKNRRLRTGLEQRVTASGLPKADIWIQAASAGEAYIAARLIQALGSSAPLTVLVTTTTRQGMEILEASCLPPAGSGGPAVRLAWFPFDIPDVTQTAVDSVTPDLMVLLETELWPGLLRALTCRKVPSLIVNARMSAESFRFYRLTRRFWTRIAPAAALAISPADAARYRSVFPKTPVTLMPNIKFDTMDTSPSEDKDRLAGLFSPGTPLTLLASVRRPEETDVSRIIPALFRAVPDQVIAVVPRHMHRLNAWKHRLGRLGLSWCLRSALAGPARPGTVVLWDTFGELRQAYALADAAFVGGSLKPLGGQNFLEPLMAGTATVTGPYLDDFEWVGNDLFTSGLAVRSGSWQEAADSLTQQLTCPWLTREDRAERVRDYILDRRGGTRIAAKTILNHVTHR